jgi:hypothetical protein
MNRLIIRFPPGPWVSSFEYFTIICEDIRIFVFMTGVNNTGEKMFTDDKKQRLKFIAGVVGTDEHTFTLIFIAGVVYTHDKFITSDNDKNTNDNLLLMVQLRKWEFYC